MKLVLLQTVKGLGQSGQIVEVSDAYARNFLIPKKMGAIATPALLAKVQATRAAKAATAAKEAQETLAAKAMLEQARITITGRGQPGGKLYQAVKAPDFLAAIAQTYHCHPHGVTFEPATLKTAGVHHLQIHWPDTSTTTIEVVVTATAD